MRKLFKERKLFKGGNYMRKYGTWFTDCKCLQTKSEHNKQYYSYRLKSLTKITLLNISSFVFCLLSIKICSVGFPSKFSKLPPVLIQEAISDTNTIADIMVMMVGSYPFGDPIFQKGLQN